MTELLSWFHFDWFLLALAGAIAGFLIGGIVKLKIVGNLGSLPRIFSSWPVVLLLLVLAALFVNILQEAVRVGCVLSGFGFGFIVRQWWSKLQQPVRYGETKRTDSNRVRKDEAHASNKNKQFYL